MRGLISPRLAYFVVESNRIEGIHREPLSHEITAHDEFLRLSRVTVNDLKQLVGWLQPGARIRSERGMDVRVGGHLPPEGGPAVYMQLKHLLRRLGELTPYEAHREYECLHPFMDGNGRSGRALWAWQMLNAAQDPFALPFLHRWYYQSLDGARS